MLIRCSFLLALLLPTLGIFCSHALGQFAGARGGVAEVSGATAVVQLESPSLTVDMVQGYITVDGRAEIRVPPTEIRIVLAVTAEGLLPNDCRESVDAKVSALRNGCRGIGIADQAIIDDFIALLPRYKFELQEKDAGQRVAVESKSGYLLQSNLHIAVKNDQQAMKVLRVAFSEGVSDILAFDYWNDQIEELRKQALASAVSAAKEKSQTLLAVFEKQPQLINVAESTQIIYPSSLYQSIQSSHDDDFYGTGLIWRDVAIMRLFRPKNTYYRGLFSNSDIQPKSLPMKSEISVVSTVKLYYESPVAKEHAKLDKD